VTPAAVSDAGPLLHPDEAGSVELLETFDTLLVPETGLPGSRSQRYSGQVGGSLMRALQRETSLFVTEAVVERGIQMLDEQNGMSGHCRRQKHIHCG
jgi:hypothetical protein